MGQPTRGLVTATAPEGATAYTYDKAARLVTTTLPNAIVENRSYDAAGRLTAIADTKGATSVASFAYTRDAMGNPTAVVASSGTQSYGYDAADRLTSVCYAASCGAASSDLTTWAYDPVGNRTAETTGAVTTSSTYDDADQLTTTGLGLLTTTAYSYDPNGHQTAAGSDTFAYDMAGRMTSASTSNGTVKQTYAYDGDGKRLRTTNTTPVTTTQTNTSWDTSLAVPEVALERDGGGAVTRSYSYGLGRSSTTAFGATSFYLHDGIGSVAKLTSATGTSQWTYAYQPFGTIKTKTQDDVLSLFEQPMHYAGEQLDATGLYHLRARQYDPATGRFTTTDPLAPSINDPYVSAYVYVDNRPGVLVDPTGERGTLAGGVVMAGVTGVAECVLAGWARAWERTPQHNATVDDIWSLQGVNGQRGFPVPGGSFKCPGNTGFADVANLDSFEVWEVKPWSAYGQRTGTPQLANYVQHLKAANNRWDAGRSYPQRAVTAPAGEVLSTFSGNGPIGQGVRYYATDRDLRRSEQRLPLENLLGAAVAAALIAAAAKGLRSLPRPGGFPVPAPGIMTTPQPPPLTTTVFGPAVVGA